MTTQDFSVIQANGFSGALIQVLGDDAPVPITGAKISLKARATLTSQPIISLSVGKGLTITDGPNGWFQIDPQVFPNLIPGDYAYDILVTIPGALPFTPQKGVISIIGVNARP